MKNTAPTTNMDAWKTDDPFLLGNPIFRGETVTSSLGRVNHKTGQCLTLKTSWFLNFVCHLLLKIVLVHAFPHYEAPSRYSKYTKNGPTDLGVSLNTCLVYLLLAATVRTTIFCSEFAEFVLWASF